MEGPIIVEPPLPSKTIPLAAAHSAQRPTDQHPIIVVHRAGERTLSQLVASILGRSYAHSLPVCGTDQRQLTVTGLEAGAFLDLRSQWPRARPPCTVLNTHCVDDDSAPDAALTDLCDYEFLYYTGPFLRKHLTRFLAVTLGQSTTHRDLLTKPRTTFISTTFPDIRAALPNLDILSVGSDAVEVRVDLLKEPGSTDEAATDAGNVPSLQYVGRQVAQLRQRTELPIIFTTRCTAENGRFPMDDPELYHRYLYRAIQWGIEYIDVELWLPTHIRRSLWEKRGHSMVMSAFHDFSGHWKWLAPEAEQKFQQGLRYAHIVKMIALVTAKEENFALECFRSMVQSKYPQALLSAVNMSETGKLSRVMNKVFSPITHPLLPVVAAPGQLTAAEINQFQHMLGQMPRREFFAIGSMRASPEVDFIQKCFNELGLPHEFTCTNALPAAEWRRLAASPSLGGVYANPPISVTSPAMCLGAMTDAAKAAGAVDTVTVAQSAAGGLLLRGHNALWKGIHATLTRDFVAPAYQGRSAIVIAENGLSAGAAIYTLHQLGIEHIYTVGFRALGPLAALVESLTDITSLQRVSRPSVIVSALPAQRSSLPQPLLRHFAPCTASDKGMAGTATTEKKVADDRPAVFLDLSSLSGDCSAQEGSLGYARALGWTVYGSADVRAWTLVETLRLLTGQNVPYDFVQMASGGRTLR
ncbi:hypothetical protein KEM52_000306 [Ascosphaera acerosa]|nr:hypothetical protein KEM52_000306 [Ascosphaera acerosa]